MVITYLVSKHAPYIDIDSKECLDFYRPFVQKGSFSYAMIIFKYNNKYIEKFTLLSGVINLLYAHPQVGLQFLM